MFRLRPLPLWLMTERRRKRLVANLDRADEQFDKALDRTAELRRTQDEVLARQATVIARQKELLAVRGQRLAIAHSALNERNQLVAELTQRLDHAEGRA